MKHTIIVNIPMTDKVEKKVYLSSEKSLPASEKAFSYPVLSYLEKTLQESDEIKFILIVQKSEVSKYEKNLKLFKEEAEAISRCNNKPEYVIISSEFEETIFVHEALLKKIVENIEDGSNITADITFGSKDIPIVEFTALNFAVDHLDCRVNKIIYGQALFGENSKIVKTELCDMSPLFSLSSLASSMTIISGGAARKMLNTLIDAPVHQKH